jgi:hypothetical protein
MEGANPDIFDPVLLKRILLTAVGLFSCFMGLWIYKSTVQGVGFLVGAAAGAYIVLVAFAQSRVVQELPNLHYILLVVGTIVICGFLGSYLARAFEYILFFLAGGVIAIILARLWAGDVNIDDLRTFEAFRQAIAGAPPQPWEIVVFFVGGLLYILNVGPIVALTTAGLGAVCLRWAWFDVLEGMGPGIPNIMVLVFTIVGTAVQLAAFRRKMDMIPPKFRRRTFM